MKLKKIVSIITSAAVAGSCAFGMFSSAASAAYSTERYKMSDPFTDQDGNTVYGSIADYYDYHSTTANEVYNVETPSSGGAPYTADTLYTILSRADLETIAQKNLTFNFSMTDKFNDYGTTYTYRTTVDKQTVLAASTLPAMANIALLITRVTNTETPTIQITSAGVNLGGLELEYVIPWTSWNTILAANNIPTSEDVFYTYDGGATYTKIKANTDAHFVLTGNRTLTMTYNTDEYYMSQTQADDAIRRGILGALGYTDEQIDAVDSNQLVLDDSIKNFVDNALKDIKKQIYETDANGNITTNPKSFVTDDQIGSKIREYFQNSSNLNALADALLNTTTSQDIIEDAVYNIFGDDTTERQKKNLIAAIWEDLVSETVNRLGNRPSEYKNDIDYFLSAWSTEALTNLSVEIGAVKDRLKDSEGNELSLTQVLEKIKAVKDQLTTTTGKEYTIDDIISAIQNAENKAIETAENNTKIYINNQGYAYQSDLKDMELYINGLRNEINELENRIHTLQNTRSSTVSEWITDTYGTYDRFITEVANDVVNRIGYNTGSSGESAYEIAVRNGYRGTEQEWLRSLVGESAYEIAVRNGFYGTEDDWLESLRGEDGEDGIDGVDGRDGEDGRIVYVYGDRPTSSVPADEYEDEEEVDPDSVPEQEVYIDDEPESSAYGTTTTRLPAARAGDTAAAPATNASKTANPNTGVAAGVIIPAAAVVSFLLIKKDKRKRGRK